MSTDTGMLATFASRLLFHARAASGPTPLPNTVEAPMSHTQVAPFQVVQRENRELRDQLDRVKVLNENLTLKYDKALRIIAAQQEAVLALRVGLAAVIQEQGGRLPVSREAIAAIESAPDQYELGEENDPEQPVLMLTITRKQATLISDEQGKGEPATAPKLVIASR